MRTPARRLLAVPLALALLLTGCTSVVDGDPVGQGSAHPAPTSSATATPSAAAASLHAELMAPPTDSVPWGIAWARVTYPTTRQFATRFYPTTSTTEVLEALDAEGIRVITHVTWIDVSSTQADIVLTRFGNVAGANVRFDHVTDDGAGFPDTTKVAFTSNRPVVVLRDKAIDSDGYVRVKIYAHVGNVVMEMYTFSRGTFDATRTFRWARTQIARLH